MHITYQPEFTKEIEIGQFVKTVASSGTPEQIWPGVAQVSTVTTVADVAGSLAGTFYDCSDSLGPVRVYFTVAGLGTVPSRPQGGRLIVVALATNDANTVVATKLNTIIDAEAEFISTALAAVVTVTQASKGERMGPRDGTTGFTFAVTTAGVAIKQLVPSVSLSGYKARGTANTGNVWFGPTSTNDAQLELVASATKRILRAPPGGAIDLGDFWIDVATNGDGVIVSYPAAE